MAKLRVDKIAAVGVSTETTGSVFFDGTSDYLSPDPQDPDLILGDTYTVEWWHYLSEVGTDDKRHGFLMSASTEDVNSNEDGALAIYAENDGDQQRIRVRANNTGSDVTTPTGDVLANVWQHWAVSVDSNSCKIFLNGHLRVTGSTNGSVTAQIRRIGSVRFNSDDYSTKGFISNLRILKDVALYTEDFVPSTKELEVIDGTVLLCCYDGHNKNAEKLGKPLKAVGDPLSSPTPTSTASPVGVTTNNPGLTRDVDNTFGPTFQGGAAYASQNWLTLPRGTTEQQYYNVAYNANPAPRGLRAGGQEGPGNTVIKAIDFTTINSGGDAVTFGDLLEVKFGAGGIGSPTRGLFCGGGAPGRKTAIEYVTISTQGDAQTFGDLTGSARTIAGSSGGNSTRGLTFGGATASSTSNVITGITIATTGSAVDFGDCLKQNGCATVCSPTRAVSAGGDTAADGSHVNTIEYLTIQTMGNTFDFGDLITVGSGKGVASTTRGVFSMQTPSAGKALDYVTIASTGNAVDFGDLITNNLVGGAAAYSSLTRGVFAGIKTPSNTDTIEFITMATLGDATDFGGDLTQDVGNAGGLSNGHGGLG